MNVRQNWKWTTAYLFGDDPGKEWAPSCLNPGRSARVNLMIWFCITYEGVGTVVYGNINARKYIEVVDNFVWPVIARHFPDDNYDFQDDNARVHRARLVKEYMEETMEYMES